MVILQNVSYPTVSYPSYEQAHKQENLDYIYSVSPLLVDKSSNPSTLTESEHNPLHIVLRQHQIQTTSCLHQKRRLCSSWWKDHLGNVLDYKLELSHIINTLHNQEYSIQDCRGIGLELDRYHVSMKEADTSINNKDISGWKKLCLFGYPLILHFDSLPS